MAILAESGKEKKRFDATTFPAGVDVGELMEEEEGKDVDEEEGTEEKLDKKELIENLVHLRLKRRKQLQHVLLYSTVINHECYIRKSPLQAVIGSLLLQVSVLP